MHKRENGAKDRPRERNPRSMIQFGIATNRSKLWGEHP